MELEMNGKTYQVDVKENEGGFHVTVDGVTYTVDHSSHTSEAMTLIVDGRSLDVVASSDAVWVHANGRSRICAVTEGGGTRRDRGKDSGSRRKKQKRLTAPLPGKVIRVPVQQGHEVKEGDLLCVIEAMKMENQIRSVGDGEIAVVHVKAGDQIDLGALIIEFKE